MNNLRQGDAYGPATDDHANRHLLGGLNALDFDQLLRDLNIDPAIRNLTLGDVLVALGSPVVLTRYGWTAPAANVRKVFGGDNGETVPTYKNALDATLPVIVTPGGAGAAGTSLIFSHRDHDHVATDVASAAALTTLTGRVTLLEATSEVVLYKASDQQLTSNSTVYQDITSLALPLAANEVWQFHMSLLSRSSVAAAFKFQFTVPAGAVMFFTTAVVLGGVVVTYISIHASSTVLLDGTAANVGTEIAGFVVNGGTAGNMQLQAAQNVATVENTDFVVTGSNLVAKKAHP